jgi:uncharacterized protein (UPF0254 family)
MVLGVNLCVLPAKHKQDITRTVRTATASLDHSIARLHQVVAIEPRAVNLAAAQEQSQELARSIREAAADLVDSIKGLREILTSQLPAPEAAANQQDNKGTPSDGRSHDRQTSPGGKMDK